ncbi:hypothetical protein CHS0354_027817, partial [Potamilus streckersoni]
IAVLAVVWLQVLSKPQCESGVFKLIPKDDCSGYYLCNWEEPETIEEKCLTGSKIIPHVGECQLYYNCSVRYQTIPRYFEQHLDECSYPKLFSTVTDQCEDFDKVVCGERIEHKSGCDYRKNKCSAASCVPCSLRFPSCENLPDGPNVHEQKLWSPFFVHCYKGRTMIETTCPNDPEGRPQIFHPETKECTSLDQIDKAHGGMMPDCTGKPDGFYLDDFGRCDQYVACKDGKFLNYVKCTAGEVYDSKLEYCRPKKEACSPCGERVDW